MSGHIEIPRLIGETYQPIHYRYDPSTYDIIRLSDGALIACIAEEYGNHDPAHNVAAELNTISAQVATLTAERDAMRKALRDLYNVCGNASFLRSDRERAALAEEQARAALEGGRP